MFIWLKKLFRRKQFIVRNNIAVETDNPIEAEVASRAILTGKMVYGSVDDDGRLTIKEADKPPKYAEF